jgi:hypothetical protein
MIPDKIMTEVDRITEVSRQSLRKYIPANSYDKFLLVAVPFIYDELMTIAGEMTGEELTEGDWWADGFRPIQKDGPYARHHRGLMTLSSQIASEIYASE